MCGERRPSLRPKRMARDSHFLKKKKNSRNYVTAEWHNPASSIERNGETLKMTRVQLLIALPWSGVIWPAFPPLWQGIHATRKSWPDLALTTLVLHLMTVQLSAGLNCPAFAWPRNCSSHLFDLWLQLVIFRVIGLLLFSKEMQRSIRSYQLRGPPRTRTEFHAVYSDKDEKVLHHRVTKDNFNFN